MKRLLAAVLASAGLMLSTSAFAQFAGSEVGIQGGYGWGTTNGAIEPGATGYEFRPDGGLGGAHIGWNWQRGPWVLGVEGDAEGGEITAKGGIGGAGVTARSQLDFDASLRGKMGFSFENALLYGTGGVAFGNVDIKYVNAAGATIADPGRMRIGWTVGGGVEYALTRNWGVGAEYRYTDLGSQNAALGGGFSDSNSFRYSMVRLALTYRFAPPPPPPPAPMAQPMPVMAPAPPPPPPPRAFLVFFDFDRAELTPDARRVVEAAAASYKATGSARLDVAGYTDLAGTQAYNLRLSQRRADAVAGYLAQQGVPRDVMDVKWFGKEHPRVPTPDGVREPQNRRVEIVMP